MTTTHQGRTSRRGRAIAATLLASAASVVGMMSAAPAQAADQYIALALGYVNENPPVTMAGGSSISASQDGAAQGALTNCVNNGGSHCVTVVIGTNECAAAASNNYGEEVGAKGASVAAASTAALGLLQNQTGAKVIVTGCSNGATTRRRRTIRRHRPLRSWGRRSRSTRSWVVWRLTSPTAVECRRSARTRRTTTAAASRCRPTPRTT